MSLMPILLIVIVLILLIVPKLKLNFLSYKVTGIVVCLYILVGLISFTSLKIAAKDDSVLTQNDVNIEMSEEHVWSLIDRNRADEIDNSLLKDEWSFEVPEKQLLIEMDPDGVFGLDVAVQYRDDPNSQEVIAKMYQIPYIIEGINISDKVLTLPKTEFDQSKSQLTINEIPQQNLTFYKLTSSLLILENNFNSNEALVNIHYSSGNVILYLNVPKHITIIDKGGFVIYP